MLTRRLRRSQGRRHALAFLARGLGRFCNFGFRGLCAFEKVGLSGYRYASDGPASRSECSGP